MGLWGPYLRFHNPKDQEASTYFKAVGLFAGAVSQLDHLSNLGSFLCHHFSHGSHCSTPGSTLSPFCLLPSPSLAPAQLQQPSSLLCKKPQSFLIQLALRSGINDLHQASSLFFVRRQGNDIYTSCLPAQQLTTENTGKTVDTICVVFPSTP